LALTRRASPDVDWPGVRAGGARAHPAPRDV